MTALMLGLSGYAGGLSDRIGARIPMTVGPLFMAGGFLLMRRIAAGSDYWTEVLPAVVVLGLGLVCTVAPLTATVLSSVEDHHAGIASGVNNAVARSAQLMAVAAIPVAAGITGDTYRDMGAFHKGFGMALWISAVLAVAGAAVAWLTLGDRSPKPTTHVNHHTHCALEAPPLADHSSPTTSPTT
jgi:MFS family permease